YGNQRLPRPPGQHRGSVHLSGFVHPVYEVAELLRVSFGGLHDGAGLFVATRFHSDRFGDLFASLASISVRFPASCGQAIWSLGRPLPAVFPPVRRPASCRSFARGLSKSSRALPWFTASDGDSGFR